MKRRKNKKNKEKQMNHLAKHKSLPEMDISNIDKGYKSHRTILDIKNKTKAQR